jgi:hypothetical protein
MKTMLGVPCPDTSVAFASDHMYVAPPPASGTDAEPVAPGQTRSLVVIVAESGAPAMAVDTSTLRRQFVEIRVASTAK